MRSSLGPETTPASPLAAMPVDTLGKERKPPYLMFWTPQLCFPPSLTHPWTSVNHRAEDHISLVLFPINTRICSEFTVLETGLELARGINVLYRVGPLL